MIDQKLPPYSRLKSILTENELTDRAKKNLDQLFDEEKKFKNGILIKILKLIKRFDSLIFKKRTSMFNTSYHRRRKI